jgi:hypothetical protein
LRTVYFGVLIAELVCRIIIKSSGPDNSAKFGEVVLQTATSKFSLVIRKADLDLAVSRVDIEFKLALLDAFGNAKLFLADD